MSKEDEQLNEMINSVLSRPLNSGEEEEDPMVGFEKAMKEVPLLMPEGYMPENIEDNPQLLALQSLLYDGTPEENAENFKTQGNDSFKEGKKGYKNAIEFYTKGIEQKCSDNKLNSVLYINRAAVHLELQNYRMAINDCKEGLKFDDQNIKAFYRMTKAAFSLDKLDEAISYCNQGLKIDPKNQALKAEEEKINKKLLAIEEKERQRQAQLEKEQSEKLKLAKAIQERGIKCVTQSKSKSQSQNTATISQLYLDENNRLHFPVFLIYPESKQTDLINDFCEDDRFIDHLQVVFEESPPWDYEKKYVPEKLVLYFETKLKDGKVALVKVGNQNTLKQVITHPNYTVVDNSPGLMVLVKDSVFEKEFVNSYKK